MATTFSRATALARPIDPTVASNRFAIFSSAVVVVAGTLATSLAAPELGVTGALGRGLRYGVGAFLAWAIARELDPDRTRAARDAVLAYLPAMVLGTPALAGVVALLLAARITVRSTGRVPTVVDLVVLVGVAGVAATSAPGFVAAAALAWAVWDDGRLPAPAPQPRTQLAAVAVAAAALVGSVLTGSFLTGWRAPRALELVWIVVVVVAVVVRPRPTAVRAVGDDGHTPLDAARVVRARWLVVGTLAAALLWAGGDAVPALAPAAAAVVGVATTAPRSLRPRDMGTPVEPPTGASL
jgi:hypothetical protein